jgi:LDH2 family malate/lactate/ureidoglycolate dehydrogenase
MDHHLRALRASGGPGAVHIPGAVAAELEEDQRRNGISVGDVLLDQLRALGERLGVKDNLD